MDYDLPARLFPADKRLEGTAAITSPNNAPDTLNQLHLELAQNLHKRGAPRLSSAEVTGGITLRRVAVNGTILSDTTKGPRYSVENTQLVLRPGHPLPPDSSATLEVDWGFTIPQAGAGGRVGYPASLTTKLA